MKRHPIAIHFSTFLIVVFLIATPALAQESSWKQLDVKIDQLQKQGKNDQALPIAEEPLRVSEATFGAEHVNTLTAMGKLAAIYTALDKVAEAEPLYKRSLAIIEKTVGPDYPALGPFLQLFGNLYFEMGNYAAAEPLYKRSLSIREKTLGVDHPDVAAFLPLWYENGHVWRPLVARPRDSRQRVAV